MQERIEELEQGILEVLKTIGSVKDHPLTASEVTLRRLVIGKKRKDQQHWNIGTSLPTPGCWLKVKVRSGEIIRAIRPSYITSRKQSDLGYRDENGNPILDVIEWIYE